RRGAAAGGRIEPEFSTSRVPSGPREPVFDADDDEGFDDEEDFSPPPARRQSAADTSRGAGVRVDNPAPRPQQGGRVQREAQTSLISSGRFEMPSLHFLSEPKSVARDPSLSKDALEQNARLLEGVLEDFGVKGEIIHVRPGPVVTLYELE
ncbi:DNA translocase FtsK, partial [Rhizobiaceae sp. 2RAB30]